MNTNRCRQQKLTSADQVPAQSISEVVEHTVSIFLKTKSDKMSQKNIDIQKILSIEQLVVILLAVFTGWVLINIYI